MYRDKEKQSSPVKVAGNLLLKEKATPNGHYVVIDAPSLRSFTALTEKGVTPQNILVINKDQKVIDKVKEHGGRVYRVHANLFECLSIVYSDYQKLVL